MELTCFAYDGVERIRDAMRAAEAAGSEDCPVRMKLVAPPLYVLTTQTLDKTKGIEVGRTIYSLYPAIWGFDAVRNLSDTATLGPGTRSMALLQGPYVCNKVQFVMFLSGPDMVIGSHITCTTINTCSTA